MMGHSILLIPRPGPANLDGQSRRYTGLMHPPVRLVAIDMDGTLLATFAQQVSRRNAQAVRAAQAAGITVAIATGRRTAYTTPLLDGVGLRADTPLITSNGAVTRTLGGEQIDHCHLRASVARELCGLLRPFGTLVFTFDRLGKGELVLEDLEQAHSRIEMWVEANRNAIESFLQYNHEQGVTANRLTIDQVFAGDTLDT